MHTYSNGVASCRICPVAFVFCFHGYVSRYTRRQCRLWELLTGGNNYSRSGPGGRHGFNSLGINDHYDEQLSPYAQNWGVSLHVTLLAETGEVPGKLGQLLTLQSSLVNFAWFCTSLSGVRHMDSLAFGFLCTTPCLCEVSSALHVGSLFFVLLLSSISWYENTTTCLLSCSCWNILGFLPPSIPPSSLFLSLSLSSFPLFLMEL